MNAQPWVSFDSRADALRVVFADSPVAKTIEVGDERMIDLDAAGNVAAIEVLGVSAGFALDDLAERYGLEEQLRAAEPYQPKQFYRHYA